MATGPFPDAPTPIGNRKALCADVALATTVAAAIVGLFTVVRLEAHWPDWAQALHDFGFDGLLYLAIALSLGTLWFVARRCARRKQARAREAAAAAAREIGESRYRDLVQAASQGLLVHRDLQPLFANDKLATMLGYDGIEQVLAHGSLLDIVAPPYRDKLQQALQSVGAEAQAVCEVECLRADGSSLWVETVSSPVAWEGTTAVLSTLSDIAARKAAEAELARSKLDLMAQVAQLRGYRQRLEEQASEAVDMADALSDAKAQLADAIESISEGFALWDHADRLVMCNDRYRNIYPDLADILTVGVTFERFVRTAYERGVFVPGKDDIEACVESRVQRHRSSVTAFEQENGDGRWIRISKRKTKNGRIVGILTDVTALKHSEAEIQRLAMEDSLTGLPNRVEFTNRLRDAILQAQRTGKLVGVMLLDLDHFKTVNDTLGHHAGDMLLCEVARRLLLTVRKSDTVARLGGDEFAVIASNAKDADGVLKLGFRLVEAIARPFMLGQQEVHTGTSVGITISPLDPGDAGQLLRNADMALYRAKESGRGTCQLYDEAMHVQVQARRALELDLRRALDNDELALVYQPQIDVASGQVVGAEALLRWHHPERGLVSPGEFVPVAEATRLILPITDWVLHTTCAQIKAWQQGGLPQLRVSMNMSPLYFRQEHMVAQVRRALQDTGVEPCCLEMEITESMAMAAGEDTMPILNRLKRLGISLSIDDFGTGYSSLERLKHYPVDRLKIDRSFVQDIATDRGNAVINSAVIRLGHSLGVTVIAEGVETEIQIGFLVAQGCDELQGFYFAKPLSAHDFADFLQRHDPEATRAHILGLRRTDAADAGIALIAPPGSVDDLVAEDPPAQRRVSTPRDY